MSNNTQAGNAGTISQVNGIAVTGFTTKNPTHPISAQAWTPDGSYGLARTSDGRLVLMDKTGQVAERSLTPEDASAFIHANGGSGNANLMNTWNTFMVGGKGGERHLSQQGGAVGSR